MKVLIASVVMFLLVSFIAPSYQQPVISGAPIVANLHEETAVETELVCINCTSPDNKNIEVSDQSITPSARFFDVYRIDGSQEFCIRYLPSQGSPEYKRVRAYNILIRCTDSDKAFVEENVEIRIRTNEPPRITSPLSETCSYDAKTTTAGTNLLGSVITFNDTDNDVLTYTLTTVPASAAANYEIVKPNPGYEEIQIAALNNLDVECNSDVTFYINVTDNKHTAVGPVVVSCTVNNKYTTPKIANVDKEIFVSEDTAVDTSLITFVTEPNEGLTMTYEIATVPASAVTLFDVTSTPNDLKLAGLLNYENTQQRNINVSIKADNGKCPPDTQYLYIRVTDANDLPQLGPKNVTKTVYEGTITVNPEFTITDEDLDDSHTYSIVSGNDNGYFTIDPATGVISSSIVYDVDQGRMPTNATLLVQVQDQKGGAIDNATVNLYILDANDNPPEFSANSTSQSFTVSSCGQLGATLGKLWAEDTVDSAYQSNNYSTIVATSNSYLTVTPSGDIIQSGQIPAGTVSSLTVYAQDRGEYPGYQTSRNPVTITLVGQTCTTTQPVTVVAVVGTGTGTGTGTATGTGTVTNIVATVAPATTTTTAAPCTGFFCDAGNIALTVLGSLLALGLLGLLSALIYRYCCNRPVEVKRTWTPPRKVRPITPPTPPPRVKTPVTPKHIEIERPPSIQYVPVPVAPPQPQLMRVRRIVPVKQQQQMVKIKSMVPVTQNVRVKQLVPVAGNTTQAIASAPK